MKKEKSCGCIIFNKNKHVLLIKMTAGHWSFPKGHVEAGETEQETAYREVYEETGLTCKIINGFRYISTYSPKMYISKDVVFFIAYLVGGKLKIQQDEVQEAMFLTIHEAEEIITFDSDLQALKKAVRFIKCLEEN